MSQKSLEDRNKARVLEGFDTLFNRRDYAAAEKFWSPDYIQHSAHIEPGREGLFTLVRNLPPGSRWEPGFVVAEGDLVLLQSRYSKLGTPRNLIAVDVVRLEDGVFVEHWDVLQDEASRAESKSGRPMFGAEFSY